MDLNDTTIGPITAGYVGCIILTTLACTVRMAGPLQLYFSLRLILAGQWWRVFTHFSYFGSKFSLEFFLNLIFWVQFSNSLETINFHRRRAGFLYMLLFGSTMLTLFAWLFKLHFMGSSLTVMISYIWARRNQHNVLAWMGIIPFRAPYLPWVIVFFSALSGGDLIADLLGIVVGHIYYFLEDVCPRVLQTQYRVLRTPKWLTMLFPNDLVDDDTAFMAAALQADPVGFMQQQNQDLDALNAQRAQVRPNEAADGATPEGANVAHQIPPMAVPELVDREALERNIRRVNELMANGQLERKSSSIQTTQASLSSSGSEEKTLENGIEVENGKEQQKDVDSLLTESKSSLTIVGEQLLSSPVQKPAELWQSSTASVSTEEAESSISIDDETPINVESESEMRRRARLEALKRLGSRSP